MSPLTSTRKSRFKNFLCGLFDITTNASLEKVKTKSRNGMIAFFLVLTGANVGALITHLKLDINLASFEPFNQSPVFAIVSIIFLLMAIGAWLLPILFFCITCLIIVELFDDLSERMSRQSLHSASMELAALKTEHHKLCEVVELADGIFSPILLGMVSLYIPLICLNSYLAVNLPRETGEHKYLFLANNFFWLIVSGCILTIIMLFGSKVSEKVVHVHVFVKNLLQFLESLLSLVESGMLFTDIFLYSILFISY